MSVKINFKSGFSILIACRDASLRLPETINHIGALEITSDFNFEVIIVSNGSSDNTVAVARVLSENHLSHVTVQIIELFSPGKTDALEVAIKKASYEYLLLCDDDNWLSSEYLKHSFKIMENTEIGILGGKSEFISEKSIPVWFERFSGNYAVGAQDKYSGATNVVWGAGMVIRHSLYTYILGCDYKLLCGRKTFKNYIAGEDYELCRVIKYFNYKVWYDDKLILKHFITSNRLTWSALKNLYTRNLLPAHYMSIYDYVDLSINNNTPLDSKVFFQSHFKSLLFRFIKIIPKALLYQITGNSEGKIHILLFYRFTEEIKEVWKLRYDYDNIFASILRLKKQARLINKSN